MALVFARGVHRREQLRYRQVIRTVPLHIGRPVWVDDVNFDLQFHVRQPALAQPGDDTVLERLISRLMAQQFDRARPLWELWSVEGLSEGRWVLLGVDRFTAMVNPGESAIVAVGRTTERLVPRGRTIAVVPTLTITLSFDHRVVDGAVGGAALGELAGLLEGGITWRP